jgi:uncharacterized repeat protein (TIGR03843 family)
LSDGRQVGPLPREQALGILAGCSITLTGQFVWGSNYTFLVRVACDQDELQAVYKPSEGEQPLWDFPRKSLAQREVAAYRVSEALGWDLVPPTVLRPDGPAGGGSLQLYVDADPEKHYFSFEPEDKQRLRPAALFDVLINNADRKGGHVILDDRDHLWLIDHGVCFHQEYKLRTVIWDFQSEPIPESLRQDVESLRGQLRPGQPLSSDLATLLSKAEIRALDRRAEQLLREGCFPTPGPGRAFPWPLV